MAEGGTHNTRKVVKDNKLPLLGTVSTEKKRKDKKPPGDPKTFTDHLKGLRNQASIHKEQLRHKLGLKPTVKPGLAEEEIKERTEAFINIVHEDALANISEESSLNANETPEESNGNTNGSGNTEPYDTGLESVTEIQRPFVSIPVTNTSVENEKGAHGNFLDIASNILLQVKQGVLGAEEAGENRHSIDSRALDCFDPDLKEALTEAHDQEKLKIQEENWQSAKLHENVASMIALEQEFTEREGQAMRRLGIATNPTSIDQVNNNSHTTRIDKDNRRPNEMEESNSSSEHVELDNTVLPQRTDAQIRERYNMVKGWLTGKDPSGLEREMKSQAPDFQPRPPYWPDSPDPELSVNRVDHPQGQRGVTSQDVREQLKIEQSSVPPLQDSYLGYQRGQSYGNTLNRGYYNNRRRNGSSVRGRGPPYHVSQSQMEYRQTPSVSWPIPQEQHQKNAEIDQLKQDMKRMGEMCRKMEKSTLYYREQNQQLAQEVAHLKQEITPPVRELPEPPLPQRTKILKTPGGESVQSFHSMGGGTPAWASAHKGKTTRPMTMSGELRLPSTQRENISVSGVTPLSHPSRNTGRQDNTRYVRQEETIDHQIPTYPVNPPYPSSPPYPLQVQNQPRRQDRNYYDYVSPEHIPHRERGDPHLPSSTPYGPPGEHAMETSEIPHRPPGGEDNNLIRVLVDELRQMRMEHSNTMEQTSRRRENENRGNPNFLRNMSKTFDKFNGPTAERNTELFVKQYHDFAFHNRADPKEKFDGLASVLGGKPLNTYLNHRDRFSDVEAFLEFLKIKHKDLPISQQLQDYKSKRMNEGEFESHTMAMERMLAQAPESEENKKDFYVRSLTPGLMRSVLGDRPRNLDEAVESAEKHLIAESKYLKGTKAQKGGILVIQSDHKKGVSFKKSKDHQKTPPPSRDSSADSIGSNRSSLGQDSGNEAVQTKKTYPNKDKKFKFDPDKSKNKSYNNKFYNKNNSSSYKGQGPTQYRMPQGIMHQQMGYMMPIPVPDTGYFLNMWPPPFPNMQNKEKNDTRGKLEKGSQDAINVIEESSEHSQDENEAETKN